MEDGKVKEREEPCTLLTCSLSPHNAAAHPHRHRVHDIRHHARKLQEQLQKETVLVKSRARANGERVRVFELEGHLRLTSELMLTQTGGKERTAQRNALPRDLLFFCQEWGMKVCNLTFFYLLPTYLGHLK